MASARAAALTRGVRIVPLSPGQTDYRAGIPRSRRMPSMRPCIKLSTAAMVSASLTTGRVSPLRQVPDAHSKGI